MKKSIITIIIIVMIMVVTLFVVLKIQSTKIIGEDITSYEMKDPEKYYLIKSSYDGPKYGSDPRYDYIYEVDKNGDVKVNKFADMNYHGELFSNNNSSINEYKNAFPTYDYHSTYDYHYTFNIDDNIMKKIDSKLNSDLYSGVTLNNYKINYTSINNSNTLQFNLLDLDSNLISTTNLENSHNGALFESGDHIFFIPSYETNIYEIKVLNNVIVLEKNIDLIGDNSMLNYFEYLSDTYSILGKTNDNYDMKFELICYEDNELKLEMIELPEIKSNNFYQLGNKYDENNVVFYEYNESYVIQKIYDYNITTKNINNIIEIKGTKIHSPDFIFK